MTLRLADNLNLPLDFATKTAAILAQRRKGKTYTGSVIAEEMVRVKQPFVALDPTGAWWGLRAGADGKSEGLPVVVLGGQHGDVPLERTGGRLIADLVVEEPGYYVIDFSLFESGEAERQFAVDFAERLYRAKSQPGRDFPLHLFVDEADRFIPQQMRKGSGETSPRLLGAFEAIVRRGGLRGLGTTLISQRAAVVNKNVLEMIDILFALRTVGPNDRAAIDGYIKAHGTDAERSAMLDSLASLEIGEAWVWEPGAEPPLFKRIRIRRRHTFNSSATPKPGEKRVEPKRLADVDLAALQKRMAATIEKAKADDPRELRKQLADANRILVNQAKTIGQLESRAPAGKAPTKADAQRVEKVAGLKLELVKHQRALEAAVKILVRIQAVDFPVSTEEERKALEQAVASAVRQVSAPIEKRITSLAERVEGIRKQAGDAEKAIKELLAEKIDLTVQVQRREPFAIQPPAKQPPRREVSPVSRVSAASSNGDLGVPERRILDGLAWWEAAGIQQPSRHQAAFAARYSVNGHFNNIVGNLRANGFVEYPKGDHVALTDAGRRHASAPDAPATREGLIALVHSVLREEPQRRLFKVMVDAGDGVELPREELAARSNYSVNGHFNNIVGSLKSLGIVRYPRGNHVELGEMFEGLP